MSRVFIKISSYDYAILKPQVFEIMDACGGRVITKNFRVLIKPNFLSAAKPETAVVTHPMLTRAVVEYVLSRGARPQVSDSPAIGSFERVFKESGTLAALKGLDIESRPFRDSVPVDIGDPFGRIDLAQDAVKADFVINLPKLKTHNLMVLTLGVKNLFGCVLGLKKSEWHLKMGTNINMLARLFIRIHETIKPQLTILDGILAMEGDGPGRGGTPKKLGLLLGSADTYALDRGVCHLLGIDPDRIPINRCARQMGLAADEIDMEGRPPEIGDFRLPDGNLSLGSGRIQDFVRRIFLPRPSTQQDACTDCGACSEVCPASAILNRDGSVKFDYDKCIRCYCCTEVCPHGAIRLKVPRIRKATQRLFKV
jgi:uncharacterized protein (DUF362 family)/NAD-dependent dihydropyrimidine dehydrogenase PreA subunit